MDYLPEKTVKNMSEFVNSYVEKHCVPFRRGIPTTFAARLAKTFTLFTLPIPDSLTEDALKVKCLYALWNTTIDDRIDCDHGGREELTDTAGVLHEFNSGISGEKICPKTVAGGIMKDILCRFTQFPPGPHRDIATEFLFLDLSRCINAFNYERISLFRSEVITSAEYMEFSTYTIDVRCILDIDIALMQKQINLTTIGKLREIYKILGRTFRLFNDLATFEREVYSEKSLNSVTLHGIEKGILPCNILSLPDEEKKKICRENMVQLCREIEAQIECCKQIALSKISQIKEIDLNHMEKHLDLLVKRVSGESFVKN